MAGENNIYYLLALAVLAVLVLMNSGRKSSSRNPNAPSENSSLIPVVESRNTISPSQTKSQALNPVTKREVTCEECLNPKEKCDDCIKQPGLACLKHHFGAGNNVRAMSWTDLFHRMNENPEKILNIVELGTSPLGEKSCVDTGCSTVLFSQWVKNRNELYASKKHVQPSTLYSIDSKKSNIDQAVATYSKYPDVYKNIHFAHREKLVDFLNTFDKQIDILYIDGNTKVSDDELKAIQRNHLSEIRSALPRMSRHAMVVVDNISNGHGNLVIQELSTKGFKILSDDFQAILTKPALTDSMKNEISRRSEWMAESKKN